MRPFGHYGLLGMGLGERRKGCRGLSETSRAGYRSQLLLPVDLHAAAMDRASASLCLHSPWLSSTFGPELSRQCLALSCFPRILLELMVIIMCG